MRLLAHLSDLHFGTEVPEITAALAHDLSRARPQLILVTGDITQRARKSQFARAAEFLNRFHVPKLVVPGNHDLPLYDLYRRLIHPLAEFHLHFPALTASEYADDELLVLGLNSTRRLRVRRGQLSRRQLEQMGQFFRGHHGRRFRIFMSHHPFMSHPVHFPKDLMFRRRSAVKVLEKCGVDLVLGGHSHRVHVDDLQEHYGFLSRPIITAQAGTAVSGRNFHRPQSYSLITVRPFSFSIEAREYHDGSFRRAEQHIYPRA